MHLREKWEAAARAVELMQSGPVTLANLVRNFYPGGVAAMQRGDVS